MACRFTYNGKTYDQDGLAEALREMPPSEAHRYIIGVRNIPDAPFVGSTDAWSSLALKRMIRFAAENGYDRISWDTGATNADRYDLSKQISRISYVNDVLKAWDKSNNEVISRSGVEPNDLADYIGKEPAQRLLAQAPKPPPLLPDVSKENLSVAQSEHQYHVTNNDGRAVDIGKGTVSSEDEARDYAVRYLNKKASEINDNRQLQYGRVGPTRELSGLDLKVGGEGMAGFYDKMLPASANKLGKKYGAKVEHATLNHDDTDLSERAFEDWATRNGAELTDDARQTFEEEVGIPNAVKSTVHSLKLTPALKKAALYQGFPLFAAGGAVRGEQEANSSTANTNQSGAFSGSAFARGGAVHCCIDAEHDVVSGADSSPKKVVVDRHIPQYSPRLKDKHGNAANLHKYLAVHEEAEAVAQKRGASYAKAHAKYGTPAERRAVRADGINWKDYTAEMAGYLSHIEHEKVSKPPPSGLHINPQEAIKRAAGGRVIASNIADPTPAQAKAGNYKKEHLNIHGLDITIENARGSKRHGVGKDLKPWTSVLPSHYGYFKRTEGADGDHVDVYLGPHLKSNKVWIIDQHDHETKKFDEHKIMLGFGARLQAINTYRRAFSDGKGMERIGAIHEMTVDGLKKWLKDGNTKTSLAPAKIDRLAFHYHKPFPPDAKRRCEWCQYTSGDKSTNCGLYRMVTQRMPEYFNLNPDVEPKAYCDAFIPHEQRHA